MVDRSVADVLERVKSWPPEDQAMLVSLADDIEARRAGGYVMTPEEAAAVDEGLAQLDRGKHVPSQAIAAMWSRFGVA